MTRFFEPCGDRLLSASAIKASRMGSSAQRVGWASAHLLPVRELPDANANALCQLPPSASRWAEAHPTRRRCLGNRARSIPAFPSQPARTISSLFPKLCHPTFPLSNNPPCDTPLPYTAARLTYPPRFRRPRESGDPGAGRRALAFLPARGQPSASLTALADRTDFRT